MSDDSGFRGMSQKQKLTVAVFCASNLGFGLMFSIVGPFFPGVAKTKGLDSFTTGLIVGAFEVVAFLSSPFFGRYLNLIGAKFMYVAGSFAAGYCAILFGFMDQIHGEVAFTVFCLLVRIFQALGSTAMLTATCAILGFTFPDNVSTLLGATESFNGLGLMIGFPLGGWLYQLGGYKTPFISSGVLVIILSLIGMAILPSDGVATPNKHSMLKFMKSSYVILIGCFLTVSTVFVTFWDTTLAVVLQERYKLTPLFIGLCFLAEPFMYSIGSPLWGWIGDKKPHLSPLVLMIGFTVAGLAAFFLGPMPPIRTHIGDNLWLLVICLGLMGGGMSSLIITFGMLGNHAECQGYDSDLETQGMISGIFNSFLSMGGFVGPIAGGALDDAIGFDWTTAILGAISILCAVAMFFCILCNKFCQSSQTSHTTLHAEENLDSVDESSRLLPGSSASINSS